LSTAGLRLQVSALGVQAEYCSRVHDKLSRAGVRACVYTCVRACVRVLVSARACVRACVRVYMRACVRACLNTCVHACVCVLVSARVCVRACIRACVRVYVRACIRACVRACVRACWRACRSLEMCTMLFPSHFLLLGASANMLKGGPVPPGLLHCDAAMGTAARGIPHGMVSHSAWYPAARKRAQSPSQALSWMVESRRALRCMVYGVRCTLHGAHSMLHLVRCAVYGAQCTVHAPSSVAC
jgi:hypothetical protein